MFFHIQLEHEMYLHPRYFGKHLEGVVKAMLHSEIEGKCIGRYGYVILITVIDSFSKGLLLPGGMAKFTVKYHAVVYRPFKGEVCDGTIIELNKIGIFLEVGPLLCFISRNSLLNGMTYVPGSTPACYKSEEENISLAIGDQVRLRIVGVRIDASGIFAIGSFSGDYLGPFSA